MPFLSENKHIHAFGRLWAVMLLMTISIIIIMTAICIALGIVNM